MKTYQGGCHCGAVTYEVTGEFTEGMKCNCSHCAMKGLLLSFVPESSFKLTQGEDKLTTYNFNKKIIDHRFCQSCGVQSFARGHDGSGNHMIAINLNCLKDFDTITLKVNDFDGRSL